MTVARCARMVPRGSVSIAAQHGRRMAAAVFGASFLSVASRSGDLRAFAAAPSSPFESLQFEDVKVGEGDVVTGQKIIKADYTGKLASNGKQFDSSKGRRPLIFKVGAGEVIKGWDIGIVGDGDAIPPMQVGGTRILYIPSKLGYGSRGAGGVIPPNADLIFEVTLVAITN